MINSSRPQDSTARQKNSRFSPARQCVALHAFPFLIVLASIFTFSTAQTSAQRDQVDQDDEVVRVRTDLIAVPFYVTDAKRQARVLDLTAQDFIVRDNNQTVTHAYFARGNSEVALTFVLDASGSAREFIAPQREAARDLFAQFGQTSNVSIIRFTEQPETTVPFTRDQNQILQAFDLPAQPNRRSAIFDAALHAVQSYNSTAPKPTARRIVVLISDGLDTVSRTRANTVVDEARRANVSLYVIYIPLYWISDGRLAPRRTAKGFRELATKTGGVFFTADVAASSTLAGQRIDLAQFFQAIRDDLNSQYIIGYYPPESLRTYGFHRVAITLQPQDKRRLKVETLRDGYTLNAPTSQTPGR